MDQDKALKAFMNEHFLAVIATANLEGKPEAAFVGYVCNSKYEIVIGTSNKSRKYKNITDNKSVALVIADTKGEVQYEGMVDVLKARDYESLVESGQFSKLPGLDKYRDDPTQVYLKLSPTWIRFITHGDANLVTEYTEFV
jgi:nitroimidazol reductase NimA-like FMN-containing flavoprotein (pyridoxamine 5'-phosphate oxidase superfamily)